MVARSVEITSRAEGVHMKKNNMVYVAKKFDAQMSALKKRWRNAKMADTQERIEKQMDELTYQWARHCFKQCKKIGEWWTTHRNGSEEKKKQLLPYWEQYLAEVDEYLLSNKEQEDLAEWEEMIYKETRFWREEEEDDDIFFEDDDED